MPDRYDVPALSRTADILQCLAGSRGPVDAATLLARTGISKSTLYLLLESLQRKQWIERREGGYIVGVRLFELGSAYLRHDTLQDAFRAEAAGFVAVHNEVVQMAVLDAADAVYIAREDANRPVRLVSEIGMRLPAHCCALGKALLASLGDAEVAALMPRQLARLTPRSIDGMPRLLAELDGVRREGIARDEEEVSAGLHCFAAYIGETIAGRRVAVSTSVPVDRLDARRRATIAGAVGRLARKIAVRIARKG